MKPADTAQPENPSDSGVVRVLVKYMVTLREKTGTKQEELDLPAGAVLQDVLDRINDEHDLGLPNRSTMIVLNGRGWKQHPGGLSEKITSGDTVLLFPPIMGG